VETRAAFSQPYGNPGEAQSHSLSKKVATLCALLPYGEKLCSALAVLVLKAPAGRIVLIIRPS